MHVLCCKVNYSTKHAACFENVSVQIFDSFTLPHYTIIIKIYSCCYHSTYAIDHASPLHHNGKGSNRVYQGILSHTWR